MDVSAIGYDDLPYDVAELAHVPGPVAETQRCHDVGWDPRWLAVAKRETMPLADRVELDREEVCKQPRDVVASCDASTVDTLVSDAALWEGSLFTGDAGSAGSEPTTARPRNSDGSRRRRYRWGVLLVVACLGLLAWVVSL